MHSRTGQYSNERFALLGHICFSLLVCTASACAPEADAGDDSPQVHGTVAALFPGSATLWRPWIDGITRIPVCWTGVDPLGTNARLTRTAVESTWEANSNIDFTGWGLCSASSPNDRIEIVNRDEHPHAVRLGTLGSGTQIVLNFAHDCRARSGVDLAPAECLKAVAIHEFGHALGFAHEQDRHDDPEGCENQGPDGDLAIGAYDADSVMSHCTTSLLSLSARDKAGLHRLYGDPEGELIRWGDQISLRMDVPGRTGARSRSTFVGQNGTLVPMLAYNFTWIVVDPTGKAHDNTAVPYGSQIALRAADGGSYLGASQDKLARFSTIGPNTKWKVTKDMFFQIPGYQGAWTDLDTDQDGLVSVNEGFILVNSADGRSPFAPADGDMNIQLSKQRSWANVTRAQGDFNRIPTDFYR